MTGADVIAEAERKGASSTMSAASKVILAKAIDQAIAAAVLAEREACASIALACDAQDERDNGLAMTGAAGTVVEMIHARDS